VFLTENLPPGSKIAEFDVTDPDGSASYHVKFSGPGSENYRANITELGTLSLYTADNAQIDREAQDSQSLLIEVSDVSNNTDRAILPIRILDVNDNAPEFTRKMYDVQVVEDWPRGVVIEKVHATDADVGKAAQVRYSIRGPSDVVAVNETSGVVTVAGELWGMARDAPYKFELVARDLGEPELNSSAILSLRVRGKDEVMTETSVVFLEPKNGVQIVVKENLPLDTKIYTAKAEQRGIASRTRGILTYSLKDLTSDEKEPNFAIDKESGDIFAVKNIDYEKNNEYTVSYTYSFKSGLSPSHCVLDTRDADKCDRARSLFFKIFLQC
uniref:Cadherin domain-containing protein n=1 Tax=Caenorhabditis japonica TaxID=281687 RepID=A0A8R1E4I7_CAEJA